MDKNNACLRILQMYGYECGTHFYSMRAYVRYNHMRERVNVQNMYWCVLSHVFVYMCTFMLYLGITCER